MLITDTSSLYNWQNKSESRLWQLYLEANISLAKSVAMEWNRWYIHLVPGSDYTEDAQELLIPARVASAESFERCHFLSWFGCGWTTDYASLVTIRYRNTSIQIRFSSRTHSSIRSKMFFCEWHPHIIEIPFKLNLMQMTPNACWPQLPCDTSKAQMPDCFEHLFVFVERF